MFIDSVKIHVKAGKGGNGCNSFYRDLWNMRGFADGGNGGRGADIILRADRNLRTLMDFQYNRHFTGRHGAHGSSKKQKGRDAEAVVVRVPCGTIIRDAATDCLLGTLDHDREELVVASAGKGGLGNRPKHDATFGADGEERDLLLDLKLIADAGLVGFPNAGKSTLITAISNAHSQVAAYPFTTKFPVLGVAGEMDETFVIADIPGLIEGSSQGRGLGDKFLRHVERTKVLVHVIDMAGWEGRDPLDDYRVINRELRDYSPAVAKKPQIVVANKMDLEASAENLKRFRKTVKCKVYPVSALNKQGLEDVVEAIRKKI